MLYSAVAFFITSGDGSHGNCASRFVNFTVRIDESVALSAGDFESQFYST